jgi:hypothetical protein
MQKVIGLMSSNQTREPRAGSLSGSNAQMVLYHRTSSAAAQQIHAQGFRDGEGYYGRTNLHRGVCLTDRPLDDGKFPSGERAIIRGTVRPGPPRPSSRRDPLPIAVSCRFIGWVDWTRHGADHR